LKRRVPSEAILDPLELAGVQAFIREWQGFDPIRIDGATSKHGTTVRAVLYTDRSGAVRFPVTTAYSPVAIDPSSPASSLPDWLGLVEPIVAAMRGRGVPRQLRLPPLIDDIRPWAWTGFEVTVGYTYRLALPHDPATMPRDLRRWTRSARRAGILVRRSTDAAAIMATLRETEERTSMSLRLDERLLERAFELIGEEHLRAYVAFDRAGEAASSLLVFHAPGTTAVEWVAGTRLRFLGSGAAQLVRGAAIEDLAAAKARALDLAGASIPSVAAAKQRWGGQLLPVYSVQTPGLRSTARHVVALSRRLFRGVDRGTSASPGSAVGADSPGAHRISSARPHVIRSV
jgi:hypothetical protein